MTSNWGARLLLGELLDHAHRDVAGVVDDDVEPTEVLDGGCHGCLDRGPVGDVDREGEDTVVVTDVEAVERRRAGGGDDSIAAVEGGCGEGAADATAGTRDEPGAG